MNRNDLAHATLVALALGTATIACTPGAKLAGGPAAAADATTKPDAREMNQARAALARHDGATAVRLAERAVAAGPALADRRMLLGQAYLSAGRFASAETAFGDALAIDPDQPRARFDQALARIALDRPDEALPALASLKGHIPDTDLGLALTLAGDRPNGVAMLTDIVRGGQSDARARQNLALAFALDGRWAEARGMAMQDTPPDRINDRIAGFAALANAPNGGARIATMLGTTPAAVDPGQPSRLALATPISTPAAAPAQMALALAPPAPVVPTSGPMAPIVPASSATVPVLLAAPAPTPAPLIERVAAAAPRPKAVAPGAIVRPVAGGFVVQLGAFARSTALDHAWAQASRLSPRVATFTPVSAKASHGGATIVRLSVGGFTARPEAEALCAQIKARHGACFVRATTGDVPAEWVRRDPGTRIALTAGRRPA